MHTGKSKLTGGWINHDSLRGATNTNIEQVRALLLRILLPCYYHATHCHATYCHATAMPPPCHCFLATRHTPRLLIVACDDTCLPCVHVHYACRQALSFRHSQSTLPTRIGLQPLGNSAPMGFMVRSTLHCRRRHTQGQWQCRGGLDRRTQPPPPLSLLSFPSTILIDLPVCPSVLSHLYYIVCTAPCSGHTLCSGWLSFDGSRSNNRTFVLSKDAATMQLQRLPIDPKGFTQVFTRAGPLFPNGNAGSGCTPGSACCIFHDDVDMVGLTPTPTHAHPNMRTGRRSKLPAKPPPYPNSSAITRVG